MRLVYEADRTREVQVGDIVQINDQPHRVTFFREPHKPASSGKVSVCLVTKRPERMDSEYFVGVIGAVWIEREDRGEGVAPR